MTEPVRIGDLVRGSMAAPPALPAELAAAVRAWPAAVGEAVAREAWPVRLTGEGTLLVHCRSSVWASELSHRTAALRAGLEREGLSPAPSLRFVVGSVPERTPPAERRASRQDDAAGEAARRLAQGVRDPHLRDALERAARASLARSSHAP